jgi:hypothetical protein
MVFICPGISLRMGHRGFGIPLDEEGMRNGCCCWVWQGAGRKGVGEPE